MQFLDIPYFRKRQWLNFLDMVDNTSSLVECWNWIGFRRNGYGRFRNGDVPSEAHRFSYEWYFNDIPDGLTIDHLCRNRSCVNPFHLEAVTMRENTLRGTSPAALNARKTHCLRGHEFTEANTYRCIATADIAGHVER